MQFEGFVVVLSPELLLLFTVTLISSKSVTLSLYWAVTSSSGVFTTVEIVVTISSANAGATVSLTLRTTS